MIAGGLLFVISQHLGLRDFSDHPFIQYQFYLILINHVLYIPLYKTVPPPGNVPAGPKNISRLVHKPLA